MPGLIPAFPRPPGATARRETAASRTDRSNKRMNKHGRDETVPTSKLHLHHLGRKHGVPQIVLTWSARLFRRNASFFLAFEVTVYI